jgi:hypothetical protein
MKEQYNGSDSMKKPFMFKLNLDTLGVRETVYIGNEAGCPFRCKGCGVHDKAVIVSAKTNRRMIDSEISKLRGYRRKYRKLYGGHGCHLIAYNSGSVTSPRELSPGNLSYMLKRINSLRPLPKIVSLNSRGCFVTRSLLMTLSSMRLGYRIDFDFGLESRTCRGVAIYGKKGIVKEFEELFERVRAYNSSHGTDFGLMVNFVFLPEFYLSPKEGRTGNHRKVVAGFVREVVGFASEYANRGVPLRINIHPFYRIPKLDYNDAPFGLFMEAVCEMAMKLEAVNRDADPSARTSIYIGIQDEGYNTRLWGREIERWKGEINRINAGKTADSHISELSKEISFSVETPLKDFIRSRR